jgi:small membrane protein
MIFQPSQILLIIALLVFILYVFRLRTLFLDRLFLLIFTVCGVLLVINPDLASRIANLFGIGRGADLLLYLFVIAGLFFAVGISTENKRQQRQITELVRHIAIANASHPSISSGNPVQGASEERPPD